VKISKSQLKQIIREELNIAIDESMQKMMGLPHKYTTQDLMRAVQALIDNPQSGTTAKTDDVVGLISNHIRDKGSAEEKEALKNLRDDFMKSRGQFIKSPGREYGGMTSYERNRAKRAKFADKRSSALEENLGEDMSPEAQQLYKQGQEFFGKLIEMGKNDHPEAGDILDALDEWASETSFEYVRIKSLY
jgi:hypothetical protein